MDLSALGATASDRIQPFFVLFQFLFRISSLPHLTPVSCLLFVLLKFRMSIRADLHRAFQFRLFFFQKDV